MSKYRTKITFGVLYTNYFFHYRMFFAVALLVQFATGVLLAGVVTPSTQMILLLALHGAYLVLLLVVRPFTTTLQLIFTAAFEFVLLVVFGLVYAMAQAADTNTATKKGLSYGIVILVCIVIVLLFVRSILKLWVHVTGANSNEFPGSTNGNIPQLNSAHYSSGDKGGADDTISLGSTTDHRSAIYTSMTSPSQTVKLVDTIRSS
ncbi:Aste57867_5127 [Aphanomyces stellatus]|uniref:Aste57867_5127 protein n=1 Tax=Aphanomyces stellatus TaxID=120398 RepID=A0A485KH96_9STRA|nr:hypothetical protein As57867_005114 [Aphanomyces stellatus]VFT82207.1 Aste57867_5127 [Aphanomyces stellatus]